MIFQRYKDTLPKEPTEPGVKKEYVIGCHSAEDWKYIHEVLMQDGTVIEYLFFFKNGSNICRNCCGHLYNLLIFLINNLTEIFQTLILLIEDCTLQVLHAFFLFN